MIAHLRGKLLSKTPQTAVVEAGGVGYEVTISIPTFTALPGEGNEVSLLVYTHVREDTLALFGFTTATEKRLFEKLLSISGIGPKLRDHGVEWFAAGTSDRRDSRAGSCHADADSRSGEKNRGANCAGVERQTAGACAEWSDERCNTRIRGRSLCIGKSGISACSGAERRGSRDCSRAGDGQGLRNAVPRCHGCDEMKLEFQCKMD